MRMTAGGGDNVRTHLRHPVAFRSTCDECSCIFRSSWRGEFSQPEWGIITAFVNTARVSWIIGILRASQDDRFQRTPARQTQTELLYGHCFSHPRTVFPNQVNSVGRGIERVWAYVPERAFHFRTHVNPLKERCEYLTNEKRNYVIIFVPSKRLTRVERSDWIELRITTRLPFHY